MEEIFAQFGGNNMISDRTWRRIGEEVQGDLIDITMSSTPYTQAEDMIMQSTIRGGFAYRKGKAVQKFPPKAESILQDMLFEFNRWFLMFGGFTLFGTDDSPFNCNLPDPRLGYFVGRYMKSKRPEFGWRFHEQDRRNPTGREKTPDPRARVFFWPGRTPDINSSQPFRSRLAVLLNAHGMIQEFRMNELNRDHLGAHPPLITAMKLDGFGNNISSYGANSDVTLDATEATRKGRTERAQHQLRTMREDVNADAAYGDEVSSVNPEIERVTYTADGRRIISTRGDWWKNRLPLRTGQHLERGPQPSSFSTLVEREQHFMATIFNALGVPVRSSTSSHTRGRSSDTTMTSNDLAMLRNTVIDTRQQLAAGFLFMYQTFMRDSTRTALREHQAQVTKRYKETITTVAEYLSYLSKTDQIDTEPVFEALRGLKEDELEREKIAQISELTSKICTEAHNQGIPLDQMTVMGHLQEIFELRLEQEKSQDRLEDEMKNAEVVTLEFLFPPSIDEKVVIDMAKEGILKPEEALRMFAVSIGVSEQYLSTLTSGSDFIPPIQKEQFEIQREQMKMQASNERRRLDLELLKEENRMKIEKMHMEAEEKRAKESAADSDPAVKRKAESETSANKKKKK